MVLKSNIKIILFAFFISAAGLYAGESPDIPAVSKGNVLFYIDHAGFKGAGHNDSYVEFYLMLFADQLDTEEKENNNISEFKVKTLLKDNSGNEISRKEWITEAEVGDEAELKTKAIYDQWSENLTAGEYKLKVTISDENSRKKGEAEYSFKVDSLIKSVSQVEFVSKVVTDPGESRFLKGRKSLIPNPSRRYGVLNPVMYVYYELYDLSTEGRLNITYSVIDETADTVKSFPVVEAEKTNSAMSMTHAFNVSNIPSGIYDLDINIKNTDDGSLVKIRRRFEVIQKDYVDLKPVLEEKDAEVFEKILGIVGTPEQQKIYNQVSENARGEFIVQFWKSLDPSPGTDENEFLKRIQQRFAYANKNFSWGKTEGWKTERGRVLMQYGMPEEIEHHYSEPNTLPYEVWSYRQEKDFFFVFGDLQSNGRFVLLHSDKEGEIYNSSWTEYIRQL